MSGGWIGVDLDGTLARYSSWDGPSGIGEPVPAMLARVKRWLSEGHPVYGNVEIKIVTARVSVPEQEHVVRISIATWCREHIGVELPITNCKDFAMIELWDDRAVQVEPNTGRRIDGRSDDAPRLPLVVSD